MTTELDFGATGDPHTTPPAGPPARSPAMRAYCATLARFTSAVQSTEQLLRNDDAGTREDAEQREQTAATRLRGIDRAGAAATDGLAHCAAVRTEHGLADDLRAPAGRPSATAGHVDDAWPDGPVPGHGLGNGPVGAADTPAARPGDRPNPTSTASPYHHLDAAPDDTGPGAGAPHTPVGAVPGPSTDHPHLGSVTAAPYGRSRPAPGDGARRSPGGSTLGRLDGPNGRPAGGTGAGTGGSAEPGRVAGGGGVPFHEGDRPGGTADPDLIAGPDGIADPGRGHGPSDRILRPGGTADPGHTHASSASVAVHAEPAMLRRASSVADHAVPDDTAPGLDRLRRTGGADLGVALSALGRRRDELKLAESDFATWLDAHDERSRRVALGAVVAAAATAAVVMAVVGTRMAAPAALALLIVCTVAVVAVGLGVAAARRLPRVCLGAGLSRRPDPARLATYGARIGGAALLALTAVNIGAGAL